MQQDASSQYGYHMRTKRHRKITGPTREQKIQIHFNITGRAIPPTMGLTSWPFVVPFEN